MKHPLISGRPLISSVRSPLEVMLSPDSLRPNADYYVGKVIVPPLNRRKPHMFNTLRQGGGQGLLTAGGKRKPSFKMVSNMVIQLLHSIKFSMEVPFSNMTQQPVEMQKTLSAKNKV